MVTWKYKALGCALSESVNVYSSKRIKYSAKNVSENCIPFERSNYET